MNSPNGTHGIMFHHFHDSTKHCAGQGSLSVDAFYDILVEYEKKWNILSAEEYLHKSNTNTLQQKDVCITLDDGLKCQFDIALPVLESKKINAFWFVYSSPLTKKVERIELYRYFRSFYYPDVNDFYNAFYQELAKTEFHNEVVEQTKHTNFNQHLSDWTFYSLEDRKFRYIRDIVLTPNRYYEILDRMISANNINENALHDVLWMNESNIKTLLSKNQFIGLHSHTHPTSLKELSFEMQKEEYKKNYSILKEIQGHPILAMSHPCNSYNNNTLQILDELGIKLGFRSNWTQNQYSKLEVPRIDHSYLMKK